MNLENNMKKILCLLLSVMLLLSLGACAKSSATKAESSDTVQSDTRGTTQSDEKVLVAYFSASGNTREVAKEIASVTGGDLFEIKPAQAYTSSDLDWNDKNSRVSREHDDKSLRDIELVETTPDNWADYKIVYIGYPIWWGGAAWPVNNFIKSNDFTSKTIVPFCTSSSSGIGSSVNELKKLNSTGSWKDGKRFPSNVPVNEIEKWIKTLTFG